MKDTNKKIYSTTATTSIKIIGKNEAFAVVAPAESVADYELCYEGQENKKDETLQEITTGTSTTSWDQYKDLQVNVTEGQANLNIDWSCLIDGKIAESATKATKVKTSKTVSEKKVSKKKKTAASTSKKTKTKKASRAN